MNPIDLAERGYLPDWLIRKGIRQLLKRRLSDEFRDDPERQSARGQALIDELSASAIAIETDAANAQHYEVEPAFYELVLGSRLKYSSALWPAEVTDLDQAEEAMLRSSCRFAELEDGQRVLELGCGWGSLTLWMAAQYPLSRITAVSNSAAQRQYIESRALELGLHNVEVMTCDVNRLDLDERFDRVVSVEMFEHVRNYRELLRRVGGWLNPDGKLFVHIFCHRYLSYPFETEGEGNWMGRHFFTGGLMPAADTLLHFQDHVAVEARRLINGRHYARTARAWLDNLDRQRARARAVLGWAEGEQAGRAVQRWRLFFMACEELFAYRQGAEWLVGHYRFRRR